MRIRLRFNRVRIRLGHIYAIINNERSNQSACSVKTNLNATHTYHKFQYHFVFKTTLACHICYYTVVLEINASIVLDKAIIISFIYAIDNLD